MKFTSWNYVTQEEKGVDDDMWKLISDAVIIENVIFGSSKSTKWQIFYFISLFLLFLWGLVLKTIQIWLHLASSHFFSLCSNQHCAMYNNPVCSVASVYFRCCSLKASILKCTSQNRKSPVPLYWLRIFLFYWSCGNSAPVHSFMRHCAWSHIAHV